jgi:hypothetical protein
MFTLPTLSRMLMHTMKLIKFVGLLLFLVPAISQAQPLFAARSYCLPYEGRFQLEPFPLAAPGHKLSAKELLERKNQGVYAASAIETAGTLTIPCNIDQYKFKAVIDYETRDHYNQYLTSLCDRRETYDAVLSLYLNNNLLFKAPFGGSCETATPSRVAIWVRNDTTYRIEMCQHAPGWDNGDPTVRVCNEVSRKHTDKALTDAEMAKLLRMNYQVVPISDTRNP